MSQGTAVTVELTVEPPVGVPAPSTVVAETPEPEDTSSNELIDEVEAQDDFTQEEIESEVITPDASVEQAPTTGVDRNGAGGADTFASDATLEGSSDFDFENFRDNVIASGITSQENATASLLSLSRLTGYSTADNEETIAELSRYAIASIAYDAKLLSNQLDELETSFDTEFGEVSYSLGAVSAFGVAGYILWTLRGGVLMAAALSQLPSWRMVDPLPVLDSYSQGGNENYDDDVTGFFE